MNEINKYNAQEEMLKVINHRIDKKQICNNVVCDNDEHATMNK